MRCAGDDLTRALGVNKGSERRDDLVVTREPTLGLGKVDLDIKIEAVKDSALGRADIKRTGTVPAWAIRSKSAPEKLGKVLAVGDRGNVVGMSGITLPDATDGKEDLLPLGLAVLNVGLHKGTRRQKARLFAVDCVHIGSAVSGKVGRRVVGRRIHLGCG